MFLEKFRCVPSFFDGFSPAKCMLRREMKEARFLSPYVPRLQQGFLLCLRGALVKDQRVPM
jgi:hypothetical protein